jgi:hypothetical protein
MNSAIPSYDANDLCCLLNAISYAGYFSFISLLPGTNKNVVSALELPFNSS